MNNNKITNIILYHGNCADGMTAATLVKYHSLELGFDDSNIYIPLYHGKDWIVEEILEILENTDRVISVDCMPLDKDITTILEKNNDLLILDHHISNEKRYNEKWNNEKNITAIFGDSNEGICGSMVVYNYLDFDKLYEGKFYEFVKCICARDTSHFDQCKGSQEITRRVFATKYNFDDWFELMNTPIEQLQKEGTIMEKYFQKTMLEIIKNGKQIVTWKYDVKNGKQIELPIINTSVHFGSDACNYVIKNSDYKLAAYYYIDSEGMCNVALRSEDPVDVSVIAAINGGGGHKNASGCTLKSIGDFMETIKVEENNEKKDVSENYRRVS